MSETTESGDGSTFITIFLHLSIYGVNANTTVGLCLSTNLHTLAESIKSQKHTKILGTTSRAGTTHLGLMHQSFVTPASHLLERVGDSPAKV